MQRVSKINKYNHKGLNSIYYLHPGSLDTFILDFSKQSFVKQTIDSKQAFPTNFTSVQQSNGHIWIVGGILPDKSLSNKVLELTDYLQLKQGGSMNLARFATPVALLKENFIVAAGGVISTSNRKQTNQTELYDISKGTWQIISSLEKPRANTSMCVITNRHVFIFNGTL